MERKAKYNTIVEKVGVEEVLAQLAEEASELAQAALKMRRKISGINPTPSTMRICSDNFTEEMADAFLCLEILGATSRVKEINDIKEYKLNRWLDRLSEVREDAE